MQWRDFGGFFVPSGRKADDIVATIAPEIRIVIPGNPEKLIAQGYDGASVMSGEFNGVQKKIKDEFKNGHYIHCEAHQLNLVMERATSTNPRAREFFAHLNSIPKFFSHSSDRLSVLDQCVAKRIPSCTPVRWNYNSRAVNVIYENKDALLDCFKKLRNSETVTTVTVDEAGKLAN